MTACSHSRFVVASFARLARCSLTFLSLVLAGWGLLGGAANGRTFIVLGACLITREHTHFCTRAATNQHHSATIE